MGIRIPLVDIMMPGAVICSAVGTWLEFDVFTAVMLSPWLTTLLVETFPGRLVLITKGCVNGTPCLVGC